MQCLNFFRTKHDFTKDIDYIHALSAKIEKKLSKTNVSEDEQIDKLTLEELQDINKIAVLTNFMLFKYEDKKETQLILQQFVSIIRGSIQSIECIDDEISELILSAEDSINKVKNIHSKISEKSDLEKSYLEFIGDKPKTSSINLTNFTTVINTAEYQQNSQDNAVQVI
jgi:hypothetical protein